MNLSAQDHQTFFNCDFDIGKPDYEMMQVDHQIQAILGGLRVVAQAVVLILLSSLDGVERKKSCHEN